MACARLNVPLALERSSVASAAPTTARSRIGHPGINRSSYQKAKRKLSDNGAARGDDAAFELVERHPGAGGRSF